MLFVIVVLFVTSISTCAVEVNQIIGNDTLQCLMGQSPCKSLSFPLSQSHCNLLITSNHFGEVNIVINRNVIIASDNKVLDQCNFIVTGGVITLINMVMTRCTSSCFVISENMKFLSLIDSVFRDAIVNSYGSVLSFFPWKGGFTEILIKNCLFENNRAYRMGGALFLFNGDVTVTIENSRFINNTASGSESGGGGAIFSITSSLNVTNTTFIGNSADGTGGAIHLIAGGGSTFSNLTFVSNAAKYGGAISEDSARILYRDIKFIGNTAFEKGGAIYLKYSGSIFQNITIVNNTALNDGGGIYTKSLGNISPSVHLENITIKDNNAISGSGIYCRDTPLIMNGNHIYDKITTINCDRPANSGTSPIKGGKSDELIKLLPYIIVLAFLLILSVVIICAIYWCRFRPEHKEYSEL